MKRVHAGSHRAALGTRILAFVVLIAVALVGSVTGCRGEDERGTRRAAVATSEALELSLHLMDGAGREVESVGRGEAVTLRLVLRNDTGASQSLQCGSARTHDVVVTGADGREVWRWSHGRVFAQMLTDVAVAPGESREFRVTWNQTTNAGAAVPPGRYQARGSIPALSGELGSPVRIFAVR
jgi:hypothetical protein